MKSAKIKLSEQQNQQQDQADHAGRDRNGQQHGNALSGHADQE